MWWRLNNLVQRLSHPYSTLEERMYRFHSRHHRWTLSKLDGFTDTRKAKYTVLLDDAKSASGSTYLSSGKQRTLGDI